MAQTYLKAQWTFVLTTEESALILKALSGKLKGELDNVLALELLEQLSRERANQAKQLHDNLLRYVEE